jgi:heme exporter protein A
MPWFPVRTSPILPRTLAMPDPRIAIEVRRMTKRFGRRLVLNEIDLRVHDGESIVLTGSNGAGKTTLLRAMAAMIRPSSGEVLWFGERPHSHYANHRMIGMVAHESRLYPHLTLRENLVFAARMCDVPRPRERSDALLETVGLQAHADRTPPVLSKGMRQRLSLARALIHDPPILLLDEPFEGLDADAEYWLTGLLKNLRQQARTLCYVLHDEAKTRTLADRVLCLCQGRLFQVAAGPTAVAQWSPAIRGTFVAYAA